MVTPINWPRVGVASLVSTAGGQLNLADDVCQVRLVIGPIHAPKESLD